MKSKIFFFFILLFALFGIIDAGYLTYEHYQQVIPPCTVNRFLPIFSDCGKVLRSSYSVMFGIPLSVAGVFQYSFLLIITVSLLIIKKSGLKPKFVRMLTYLLALQSMIGTIFSLYFIYIQLVIIKSICLYCMLSAFISFVIFFLVLKISYVERFFFRLNIIEFIYKNILKPILFLLDPEFIHSVMTSFGEVIGKTYLRNFLNWKLKYLPLKLKQRILGINFLGPIGLAAGFDYDAKLIHVLSSLSFGFQSVGTVTNLPYEGNPKPRLGRLSRSRSLMVNKGYKNIGVKNIVNKLNGHKFEIPLGVSIGSSNNEEIISSKDAIVDIIKSFSFFEKTRINISYYEVNISCPNLINNKVDFFKSNNLDKLFQSLIKLKIKKPIFIKMPIDKNNQDFFKILKIISKYSFIKGVIIGNLFKDRKSPLLDKGELKKFKAGYFSGKPCEPRSNELIKLTYKKYKNSLLIIGCGGVFSGQDAYKKIRLGANLIQLITGMIFQGPQLISQINMELEELLKKDGFSNIRQVVGVDA